MRKMLEWDVPISRAESEAYLHVWQVTAHLLGVRDEFIPATWDAAYAQSDQVLPPNMGPTREGVELTDVLLGQLAEQTSPGSVSRPLCNALGRYLAGDVVADWDQIRREPVWDPVIAAVWPLLVRFREGLVPLPLVPEAAWLVDEAARRYILFYLTKGRETKIEIPTTNRPG
jgi:endo-cleaving rubber dioxygenase